MLLQGSNVLALTQVGHVAPLEHGSAAYLLELLREVSALSQMVQESCTRTWINYLPNHVVLLLSYVELDRLGDCFCCTSRNIDLLEGLTLIFGEAEDVRNGQDEQ